MALIDMEIYSQVLRMYTQIRVILPTVTSVLDPEDEKCYNPSYKYQTLYLLHGMAGNYGVWSRFTNIEQYAQKYKLAVVMTSAQNSCYRNMEYGEAYLTFFTEELPKIVEGIFPLSKKKENKFVAGNSMGGYGAFQIGLEKPLQYQCICSLSGCLNILWDDNNSKKNSKAMMDRETVFGEDGTYDPKEHDILVKMQELLREGIPLPNIYQCCGTDDFLYAMNMEYHEKFLDENVEHTFVTSEGTHDWAYWNTAIAATLEWLPLKGSLVEE
ncbi:MAG: alpha/beta hydrolase family protein [Eubacteriales bacterium]